MPAFTAAIVDWDDAYANGPHIPGASLFPARWQAAAAGFRAEIVSAGRARLDLPYGPTERQRYDLFLPGCDARGIVVFVHGGYWMAFDKDCWSHLSAGALARGWAVALPSYDLCPGVSIAEITGAIGRALAAIAAEVPGPLRLTGHSAGGHLVSRMVCADSPLPEAVAARIEHVVSISGVHDVRPLLKTKMNLTLRLDAAAAAAESPALLTPRPGVSLDCRVGALERPEFLRQTALLANIWTGLGARTRAVVEPDRHHFDVIEALTDPGSDLVEALVGTPGPV